MFSWPSRKTESDTRGWMLTNRQKPAKIHRDAENQLPYFSWRRLRFQMRVIVIWEYVLKNWAYRLLLAAGHLGQAAKASCCLLPIGPFLLHLLLMRVLHDFALSRFWRGGNGRLNVNKISFHSHVVQPAAASTLVCTSVCWMVLSAVRRRTLWPNTHIHISLRTF